MKLENKFFAALFAVIFAFAIISCEGPAGEDGMDGADGSNGADGKDGEEQCGVCHNSSSLLFAKQLEWENSGHGMGTSYARGSSGSCAPCHAGQGFEVWAETGSFDDASAEGVASPTPQTCYTCHNIHDTYTTEDFALKGTQPFNLRGDMTDNIEVDMGKGNMCGKCHQTRERNIGFDPANGSGGEININSSHWGPHHGPQSNVVNAAGGYETAGGTYSSTGMHENAVDGCVSCHVNDAADHTWSTNETFCATCHDDLDIDAFQTEISDMIAQLEDHLVTEGILAVEHEGEMGHPIAGEVRSNDKAGALFNYFIIYEDGSKGVHNPRYVKALLENSIGVFE